MDDNIRRTSHLRNTISQSEAALQLLKLLGFHFQATGAQLTEPYVIYPHFNIDDLLVPTYDALRAVIGKFTYKIMPSELSLVNLYVPTYALRAVIGKFTCKIMLSELSLVSLSAKLCPQSCHW